MRQQKTYTDLFNLTRSTSRMCWNSSGYLEAVPANQPCFEWDPATGGALGQYVYSGDATNLLPNSEDDTDWFIPAGGAITLHAAVGPDGQNNMMKVEDNDTGGTPNNNFQISGIANDNEYYVASAFLRKGVGGGR